MGVAFRLLALGSLIWAGLLAGCPAGTSDPIVPVISISTTRGPAPLTISVSGEGSGAAAALASARWDFGGDGTANGLRAQHTFEDPGRYTVRLTLTDVEGRSASAAQTVRVAGDQITVVISASRTSGAAPLAVMFDADDSDAGGDALFDFQWDFGDGETSNETRPLHVFRRGGTYTVHLRAVTGGGVAGEDTLAISVSGGNAPEPDEPDPNAPDPNDPNAPDPNDPNAPGDPNDPNGPGDPNDPNGPTP